ncbi:MAG: right-handed parallel beta-helix repeat-containing protein [Candidatus Dormibacteraeota bacterium]|nr:right-handed parallel beta-helix repeat-containing protein [Candidatus Dormibacteraeota bacterium]
MGWKRRLVGVAAVAAVVPFGIGATPVGAAAPHTVTVTPGHSIQAAIDAAHPGDTIVVARGTYQESLQITTDDITLRGADGSDRNTVIEPPAVAPTNICTQFNTGPSGICVLGQLDTSGNIVRNVEGVHISGLTIRSFPQNGIFGFGTTDLEVSQVSAFNDGGYGIARFASTTSVLRDNSVAGNHEAGLYVGDSPDADTVVANNKSWGNGFGIFVRHSHEVQVWGNTVWGNCLGVFVLDDGQAGGAGNVTVTGNTVHGNNLFCPPAEGPPLSGGGIALAGAVHTLVADNHVYGNNAGGTVGSGGIVLVSVTALDGGSSPIDDTVRNNTARHDAPADIVYDGSGSGNRFIGNQCGSSAPSGLCH